MCDKPKEMYLDRRQKYQVVFLIDKSLKNLRPATNNDEGEQERNSAHKSSEVLSSPKSISQNRESNGVPPKSYTWQSISVSSFRILSYLFSQIQPHVASDHDTSNFSNDVSSNLNSRLSGAVNHLVGSSNQCNDQSDSSAENLKEQSRQIVYLKRKQASLQWSYKLFDSRKLIGKTEHHKFNDFKLRHFEEFEKELQRQFEDDDGSSTSTQPSSKVDNNKVNSGASSDRRKSNTPSAAECLKRTLSYAVYDFHWESPDITSPIRKIGRRSIRSSRKQDITTRETSPHNLVFLFQRCPTNKMEFKEFAAKLVVDSEVFLDSFMPPALFREFRVNRNLSLYWVDQDWLKNEEKVSSEMVESINIVSDALTQLGGRLMPLDALVNTGKIYWSSLHTILRQTEERSSLIKHKHSNVNEQSISNSSSTDVKEDTSKDEDHSPDKCNNQPSRCILPLTCLLDYFISKPTNCSVTSVNNSSQITNPSKISIQARLTYHKDKEIQDLCSLVLVPSSNSFKQTLLNNSTGHLSKTSSAVNKNLHVSFIDKHNQHSSDKLASTFEFFIENSEKLASNSSSSTFKSKFSTQSTQHSLSLQMEIYGYLQTTDLNNYSDCVFFCTAPSENLTLRSFSSTQDKSTLSTVHKNKPSGITEPTEEISSPKVAKFQNLLFSLAKSNLHLMVQLKNDQETPYLGILQPITINLAALTILPMGLNIQLKEIFPVFPIYGHTSNPKTFVDCDSDKLDSVLQQYSAKILHSYSSLTKVQSDKTSHETQSSYNVFDASILNKWTIPNAKNSEMIKMSGLFCKTQLHTKEIELLKKLKQLYRKADSPSRLVDKGIIDEKSSKVDTSQPSESSVSQKADNRKPQILKKLRSFTLGPTRAEMILSKSMEVVEELSKAGCEEPVSCTQGNEESKQISDKINSIVKYIANNSDLTDFITQAYETALQEKLDSWKQMYEIVNVVLLYMKANTDNAEIETRKLLVELLFISCSDLRHKYRNPELGKEAKIQEYKLQIILRMEIQCLKLMPEKTETVDTKDDVHSIETSVEDIVTMLRTLSFISDLTLVPFFLRDVLLKNYSHLIPQVVANIYDELMQPVPSVLADVMSPESDAPSTFCPSVNSFTLDESVREVTNAILQTQSKKSKTKQVLPGLGERLNRQIVIGKKSNAQAIKKRLCTSKSSASCKKRAQGNTSEETVKARRSLFTSESRKLERHRSFAVTEKEKSKSHGHRNYHRRRQAHRDLVNNKRKTIVAETPAHKQMSQVMRRWHLLQSRLTEPLETSAKSHSNTDHHNNLPSKPTSTLVIEESPMKEIASSKPSVDNSSRSESNHKTKVLIRKGFYGLSRTRIQSRNFAKYMELADRIAGRSDRYAKLTSITFSSQQEMGNRSPLDRPNTFALSQLMGFQSPTSPKSDDTVKYTPNPETETFPFSRSPRIRKRSLENVSVKQALFTTPEKILSLSSSSKTTAHCSNDEHNLNSSKLENLDSSIFKTPTKQTPLCLETPEKVITTPENKQLISCDASILVEDSTVVKNKSFINTVHEPQESITTVGTLGTLTKTPVKKQNSLLENSSVVSQRKSVTIPQLVSEEDDAYRNCVPTLLNLPTKILQTPSPKPSKQSSTPDSLDKWKRKKNYYHKDKSSHVNHSSDVLSKPKGCLHLDTDSETSVLKHCKRKASVDSNVAGFLSKRRKYNK